MTTLYQRSDDQLERLRDRLTLPAESKSQSSEGIQDEATEIVARELQSGLELTPQDRGSGAQAIAQARRLVVQELARRVDDRRLAAALQLKIDSENERPKRERGAIVSPYHVLTWIGDAKAWMEVAVELDRASRGADSYIRDRHKSNVAHVAIGFAFELTYKCLLVGELEPFVQDHSCRSVHDRLAPDTQAQLEAIMVKQGWSSAIECLKFLDRHLSNANRKYWMVNPNQARRTGRHMETLFMVGGGPMTISRLAEVLVAVLPLAASKLSQARRAWDYKSRRARRSSTVIP